MSNQGSVRSYKVTPEVREFRMPDKLRSVEQLAKMCGWNEPEKVRLGTDDELTEIIMATARLGGAV